MGKDFGKAAFIMCMIGIFGLGCTVLAGSLETDESVHGSDTVNMSADGTEADDPGIDSTDKEERVSSSEHVDTENITENAN